MGQDLHNEQTIAAVATAIAAGQGGIAVIRISGPYAISTCKNLISLGGSQAWESHRVHYGHVMDIDGKEKLDEVLVLIMQAPKSFTGEDVVEIHCHGGLIPVQRVLERVLHAPQIRRALPGEFSQRAVLNGRIELTQAEAISELVGARSVKAAQLAMEGLDGGIQRRMKTLRAKLLDQLSEIEARVDFEDELPPLDLDNVLKKLMAVKSELEKLIEETQRSSFLRFGLQVALIGCPNVGKSSLLNRLAKQEKAIVTNQPGTTRDLLESEIVLDGIPITLLDTAGIHTTTNEIEQLGIQKSNNALKTADIVILIFDLSLGWTNNDAALLDIIPEQTPKLIVGNKADISINSTDFVDQLNDTTNCKNVIFSALTGEGEDTLIKSLLTICNADQTQGLVVALNERQCELAQTAANALSRINEVYDQKLAWDFWTIDLREAIHRLGEITGDEITETLLDRIFSRFCIGK